MCSVVAFARTDANSGSLFLSLTRYFLVISLGKSCLIGTASLWPVIIAVTCYVAGLALFLGTKGIGLSWPAVLITPVEFYAVAS